MISKCDKYFVIGCVQIATAESFTVQQVNVANVPFRRTEIHPTSSTDFL